MCLLGEGSVRDAWPTPDTISHDEGTGKEEEGVDSAGVEGRSCRGVSCREVSCREVCCEASFSTNLAPTGKSGDCRRGGDNPLFATSQNGFALGLAVRADGWHVPGRGDE